MKLNEEREREHLAQSDREITDLKARIARQREVIQGLALRARPREHARELLKTMQHKLKLFEQRRDLMLRLAEHAERRASKQK